MDKNAELKQFLDETALEMRNKFSQGSEADEIGRFVLKKLQERYASNTIVLIDLFVRAFQIPMSIASAVPWRFLKEENIGGWITINEMLNPEIYKRKSSWSKATLPDRQPS